MNDDAVSDEHPSSKTEAAFNRYVLQRPPPLPTRQRQDDVGLRMVCPGPAVPWYTNAFLQSS